MKILAIRGNNLASLAGDFELAPCREAPSIAWLFGQPSMRGRLMHRQ